MSTPRHSLVLLLAAALTATHALAADPQPATITWAAPVTTGAAMGYCLAKHPYQTLTANVIAGYTQDGYEVVASPGIVGAVRRNFVYDRTTDLADEGGANTCPKACAEFGKLYRLNGRALHQKVGTGTTVINSGIGDVGSLAVKDNDFYVGGTVVAGAWSRGNTWQDSDVAQSDYCCCQATTAPVAPADAQ